MEWLLCIQIRGAITLLLFGGKLLPFAYFSPMHLAISATYHSTLVVFFGSGI